MVFAVHVEWIKELMDSIVTGGGVLWLYSGKLVLCELDSSEMRANELEQLSGLPNILWWKQDTKPFRPNLDGSIDAELDMWWDRFDQPWKSSSTFSLLYSWIIHCVWHMIWFVLESLQKTSMKNVNISASLLVNPAFHVWLDLCWFSFKIISSRLAASHDCVMKDVSMIHRGDI